jgi:hypothetical protein
MHSNIEIIREGKNITYVLSAGIDLEKHNRKFMPTLALVKDYGFKDEKYIEIWDNEHYVYDTLFNVLLPWVKDKRIKNPEDFAMLLSVNGVDLEDFPLLVELIQKGIEFGFFEEIVKNKKEKDA